MFPTTVTIHNVSDLQKVMSVLYPTTGTAEITDTSRDVPVARTNDADIQKLVDKAEAKAAKKDAAVRVEKPTTVAETPAAHAPTQPTAEADVATAAPEKTADASPPTVEPAAAEPQPSTAATASPTEPVDYKTAAEAVTKVSRAKGRPAAIEVLAKFGAAKLPDVKPEQFADVVAACNALLEA